MASYQQIAHVEGGVVPTIAHPLYHAHYRIIYLCKSFTHPQIVMNMVHLYLWLQLMYGNYYTSSYYDVIRKIIFLHIYDVLQITSLLFWKRMLLHIYE